VFSRVGSYGVSSLVTSDAPFCLGQNTVFIVPKINFRLLYYFLNSLIAKTQFDELIDGTTQPTISLRSIREVRFTVPPSHDHEKLIAYLDVVSLETHRLESLYQRKSAALDELKKSLLQKAFNGELSGE
jgi:type I restriction enzyme S subunit